jgi:diguanylate cyclase (GGDEF)-like protein/PAS domain S-box-containing protein
MSFVSDGVQSLTGYDRRELAEKNGWSNLIGAEDRTAVEMAVADAVSESRSFDLVYRIVRKTGETGWVSERGHAVYDDQGKPLFLEGVIADISGRKEADDLQRSMMERWRRTLDAIPQMVWTMAGDGTDAYFNARWWEFIGSSPERFDRENLIHVEDRTRVENLWQEKRSNGQPYEAQYRLKHASGDYRWIISRGEAEKDKNGAPIRWYGTCTDIHEKVLGHLALQASEAINRSMIEASPDCISLLDTEGNVRFLNGAALEALCLQSSAAMLGRPWTAAFPPSFRKRAVRALAQASAGHTARFTASQAKSGGHLWWDIVVAPISGDGAYSGGLISIARDITRQKIGEERIRWAANHDPLTQLPNRALFQQTLDRSLVEVHKTGAAVTVLMMDLDDFKRTNDALGHDAGDALLKEFADRLRETVRADYMVARLGGDEFAVLLQGVAQTEDVEAAVQSILTALRAPFQFNGKLLDIRTSIGASTFPIHGRTRTELLKHADIAHYAAKSSGRGVLRIFQAAMRAKSQKRLSMLGLARDAIRDDRIVANYQPKVDLRTGQLDGFEALLRWTHPTKGLQHPSTIKAAFHDGILAAEISDRMLRSVIADMLRWTDGGVPFGHVAVNAASAEFSDGRFAEKLLNGLHRANLSTSCLQLEVTETVFLGRGAEHVERTLKLLAEEGVQIALDDFGTGYASLSHLNNFPVHVIKIDRSFIEKLETSEHDAAIVRAVIALGRSLGIKIVAEGIETDGQAHFLRKHRCHSGQGYLFGKATHALVVPAVIAEWAQPPAVDLEVALDATHPSLRSGRSVAG